MNVKKASFTDEQRKEIQEALKRPQTPHVYKRLMALKLKAAPTVLISRANARIYISVLPKIWFEKDWLIRVFVRKKI
ncbi:hypothetical protein SDC9_140288 [bioreactor metagenome]|uniref:Uncharacterized protein n=1 Tax=bioreactor metagenome TaxID=1076179 RepID=A0A645DXU2_9ZZZZ